MENSTNFICDTDYKSLVNQCFEICSALKDKGCKFSLSLRLGSSFNLSLSSEGPSPEATKRTRRSPSYLRRQTRRRAAFLERKLKHPLADVVTPTTHNNPAEKAAQEEAAAVVDTSSPLDLCPIPVYPSVQEFKSLMEESEDDYDEEEGQEEADKFRQGDRKGTGYAKQGSNCEECQQLIVDKILPSP